MRAFAKNLLLACVAAALALTLAACGGAEQAGSASTGASSTSGNASDASGQAVSREDVEPILNAAANQAFSNVTFAVETETTATLPDDKGVMQTNSATTSIKGELDRSGDAPKMHMSFVASSTVELGRTAYELFIDSDALLIKQGDELYSDTMTDDMLNSYADSVTGIITIDEIAKMLDAAASYKMSKSGDETTITVTVDVSKLPKEQEADSEDESALPDGTDLATMIASYTIGSDGRFKTVLIISSTEGASAFRMHQAYRYSGYDETTLPDWPDLQAYILEQSGIKVDENGNMYFIGDDGQTYYVSEIGDDGTVYYTS